MNSTVESLRECILRSREIQYELYEKNFGSNETQELIKERDMLRNSVSSFPASKNDAPRVINKNTVDFSELATAFNKTTAKRKGYTNSFPPTSNKQKQILKQSREASNAWVDKLSSYDLKELWDYSGDSNSYSKGGHLTSNLASIVSTAPKTNRKVVVFSGVNDHYNENILQQAQQNNQIVFNKVHSASLNPAQINGFMGTKSPLVVLEILADRFGSLASISHSLHEWEVLLPAGKYRVDNMLEKVDYAWEGGAFRTADYVIQVEQL